MKLQSNQPLIIEALASSNLGGGEMVAIDLATSLKNKGRNVAVWCPSEGPSAEHARQRNLKVEILGNAPQYTGHIASQLKKFIRIRRLTAKQNISIIHCHSPFCYQQLARCIPRTVKKLAHVQIDNNLHLFPWLFKHKPDAIITCADYLADATEQSLADTEAKMPRIIAAPNSVDTSVFFPRESRSYQEKQNLTAVMLANLAPHKGHATAINAISLLKERGFPIELKIAGVDRKNAGYAEQLSSLVQEKGLTELVHFLGFHSSPESLLRESDFMILPSTTEGLPLSILEAQASKSLVIANPIAGIPEVITDGVTGFLVEHTDIKGYADTIERLIRDPEQWESIVSRAYKNIQEN